MADQKVPVFNFGQPSSESLFGKRSREFSEPVLEQKPFANLAFGPQVKRTVTQPQFKGFSFHLNQQTPFNFSPTHVATPMEEGPVLSQRQVQWPAFQAQVKQEPKEHQVYYIPSLEYYIENRKKEKVTSLNIGDIRIGTEQQYQPINDECLNKILKELGGIESLTISSNGITGSFITELEADTFKKLTTLSITDCPHTQDIFIGKILQMAPAIKTVSFNNTPITGACLMQDTQFESKNQALESLSFHQCFHIQEGYLNTLNHLAPKLSTLKLTECSHIRGSFLYEINKKAKENGYVSLKTIYLTHCNLHDDAVYALFNLSDAIEYLDLRNTPITNKCFVDTYNYFCDNMYSNGLKNLKKILLERCTHITTDGASCLIRLTRALEGLSLAYTSIDDKLFTHLAMDQFSLKTLSSLSLKGCTYLSRKGLTSCLDIAGKLKLLDVSYTKLTADDFEPVDEGERPLEPVTTLKIAGIGLTTEAIIKIADILQLTAPKTNTNGSTYGSSSYSFQGNNSSNANNTGSDRVQKTIALDEASINKKLQDELAKRKVSVVKVKAD